jgi:hypothetical protein
MTISQLTLIPCDSPQGTPSGERLFPGCRVRSLSMFHQPGTEGTVIDPRTLPQGSCPRGELLVWRTYPFVQFDDGWLMAIPAQLLRVV